MNFRDLMNKLDNINNGMLAEGLTLSAIIAVTSGYEQDDKVRIPKLAQLAKENSLEGLVDPVTGNYVSNEGDVDDEVPFEIAQKLSAAGLLPKNARLPQAGWFDNEDTFKKANADLVNQSSQISGDADALHDKIKQMMDLFNKILELRKKRADKNLAANSLGSPGANAAAANAITPPNIANTLNNIQTSMKDASAGMADPGNISKMANDAITKGMSLQNAPAGLKESYGMANALLDSFGYEQLNEDLASDAGDLGRGVWNGVTWGTGGNINAGVKSLVKGTKYKDELAGELAANKAAEERSPWLYGGGDLAGSFVAPGGAAKGLAGAAGVVGKRYIAGQAVDAANAHTLGTQQTPVGPHPAGNAGTNHIMALQQQLKAKGADLGTGGPNHDGVDGIMGPKTKAAQAKFGIKEGTEMKQLTVAESIAAMRDTLERINNPQLSEADVIGTLGKVGGKLLGKTAANDASALGKAAANDASMGWGSLKGATSQGAGDVSHLGKPAAGPAWGSNAAADAGKAAANDAGAAAGGLERTAANDASYGARGAANDATYAQGGMDVNALGKSKNYNFAGKGEKAAEKGGKRNAAIAGLAAGMAGYGALAGDDGQGPMPPPGPHPGPKPHPHGPVHKQGNPEIMKWQELLNANGEHLKVDGIYGPATQAAYDRVFPKFQPDPKFPGTNAAPQPVAESIRALGAKLSLIESGLDPAFMDQLANEGIGDVLGKLGKGAWNAGKNLVRGAKGEPAVSRASSAGPSPLSKADKIAHGAGDVMNKNPKTASFLGGAAAGAGGMAAWDAYHSGQGPKPDPIHNPEPHVHHPHPHHNGGGGTTPVTPPTPPVTPAADPSDAEMAALMAQLRTLMADVGKSSNPEAQKAVADMSTRLNGVQ
jgi:hypothetical protein